MVSTCNKEIALVCASGELLHVSQNLLEESSTYIHQVLSKSKSTVLLFADLQFEDLKDLIDHVKFATTLNKNLHAIALKYGFKTDKFTIGERLLPLKKHPLELTSPSPGNNNLVIDENLSPSKSPRGYKSVSSLPEDSLD